MSSCLPPHSLPAPRTPQLAHNTCLALLVWLKGRLLLHLGPLLAPLAAQLEGVAAPSQVCATLFRTWALCRFPLPTAACWLLCLVS